MTKLSKKDIDLKFQRENLETISFKSLKRWGLRDAIAQAAQKRGTNSRQYMLNAILNELKKDDCLPEAVKEEGQDNKEG